MNSNNNVTPEQCIKWMRNFYDASQHGSFTAHFDIGKNNAFSDTADCLETMQKQLSDALAANELLIAENRRLREPDGYVVIKSDGHYVGAWLHKDVAESVVNRSQSIKDERIAPFKLLEVKS